MGALMRITKSASLRSQICQLLSKSSCNVRELAILIAALITFSAIAAIARPHEHHFVPQATGLMPTVNVP
jgi:hypothetical protein